MRWIVELLERDSSLSQLSGWCAEAAQQRQRRLDRGRGRHGQDVAGARVRGSQSGGAIALGRACDACLLRAPLAPLLDIARQAGGPLLEAARGGAERNTLFAAALDELEARPTLVVFEDLHWADEATLDFLKFAGRRIARAHAPCSS